MDKLRAIANIIAGRPVIYNVTFVDEVEVHNGEKLRSFKARIKTTIPEVFGETFNVTLGGTEEEIAARLSRRVSDAAHLGAL
jgi:hypothetical protein